MSAADEELRYVSGNGIDHVTYVLIMLRQVSPSQISFVTRLLTTFHTDSLAFTIYLFVLVLINMWGTTGRHSSTAPSSREGGIVQGDDEVELDKWYRRVPAGEADAEPISPQFVIGEHEHEHDNDRD